MVWHGELGWVERDCEPIGAPNLLFEEALLVFRREVSNEERTGTIGSGVLRTVGCGYLSVGEADEVVQGLSDESDHLRSFVVAGVGVVDLGEEIYASVGEPLATLCIGHVFEKVHEGDGTK